MKYLITITVLLVLIVGATVSDPGHLRDYCRVMLGWMGFILVMVLLRQWIGGYSQGAE